MDAVNLLPVEYRARKRSRLAAAETLDAKRTLRMGGIVALVFAILMGGLYMWERSTVGDKQKALAQSQARVAAVESRVEKIKADQAAASAKLQAAQSITSARMNWDRALGDFARVVPTSSHLTSLQVTAPVPTASVATTPGAAAPATTFAPAGPGLTIQGVAPGTDGVAQVMDRLALLPWLTDVTLTSAARQTDGSDNFTITAGVTEEH